MKKHSHSRVIEVEDGNKEEIDWELRPGGMLVQKREDEDDNDNDNDYDYDGVVASGPLINVKVSHGSTLHEIKVPAQATFGDLKRILARETGLDIKDQRLFFRGKEKQDGEHLNTVGVKDRSKLLLMEVLASKEKKLEEAKKNEAILKACEPINKVRLEVDKLAQKVSILESAVRNGTKVDEKEFVVLTELLMVQLLKLDGIEADGEARVQRKNEVRRVQSFVEKLDTLKARNANPFSDKGNAVSVTTEWEKFDSGVGSLNAPPPTSSSKATEDWEAFD
ncbi:hypothetical protein AQUCO_04500182v1 [Aquilegia coerulea]|uniref:Ubiquitin-like domain-containing protein n=1 Tax=Aquilegia coerulea TaxID=218851 RepID=A0A2G5CNH0_AQUCA|nr:hypothetical protein AQUCO_04500182v1 [Aquilegia coerulea]